MSDQELRIEQVPISWAWDHRWQRNPKRHGLEDLKDSIRVHGFKEPLRFEPALNGGRGGIVCGNGRLEALWSMYLSGDPRPEGLEENEREEWLVSMVVGVEALTEAQAEAFGVDDNGLVLGKAASGPLQFRIEGEGYADMIHSLVAQDEAPVVVESETVSELLRKQAEEGPLSLEDLHAAYGDVDPRAFWPVIRVRVPAEVGKLYRRLTDGAEGESPGDRFEQVLRRADKKRLMYGE